MLSIVKDCQHLHSLNLPGGDLFWVPQPPACFLMESSGVDGSLKHTLELCECAIASSPLGQVLAPVLTVENNVGDHLMNAELLISRSILTRVFW